MANYHLAILKKPYLEAILDGRKQIETRFTRTNRAPFGRIYAGDRIFFKLSSGPVCAAGAAAAVKSFKNLTPRQIVLIKQQYNQYIIGSDEYWQSRAECMFGVLIWLENVRPIQPIRISKKDWRGWVILTEKENFGLLKTPALR